MLTQTHVCSVLLSSFGITPTTEKLYHSGVMRTKIDDCQFVCIEQSDYYKILHQVLSLSLFFFNIFV